MDNRTKQLCRDCSYCTVTAKAFKVSFRCTKLSAPCYGKPNVCTYFREHFGEMGHTVIASAWDLTHEVTLGDYLEGV